MKHLLPLLAVAACSSTPAPQSTGPTPAQGGAAVGSPVEDPSHTACESNDDCVIVETACCDHCNGGTAEAFHRAHADAHRPDAATCGERVCTLMACGAVTASCDAGRCTATMNPL